jgi:hypothetical protein
LSAHDFGSPPTFAGTLLRTPGSGIWLGDPDCNLAVAREKIDSMASMCRLLEPEFDKNWEGLMRDIEYEIAP